MSDYWREEVVVCVRRVVVLDRVRVEDGGGTALVVSRA